jgi:hypothetical protein
MKPLRLFLLVSFVAAIVALIWQDRRIIELRAEVAALKKDLQASLETSLDDPAGLSPQAQQARNEKLELIRLRHRVRELNEDIVQSHARERGANLRTVMHLLLPASAGGGSWQVRPEWKGMEAHATNRYFQAMQALTSATNDYVRFLSLNEAAKMSLAVGRTADARQFANDLLLLDDKYSRGDVEKSDGGAVYTAHTVLGTIALDEGRIEEAKRHLLAAGKTKGSPALCSFGPGMSLAKELLEKGDPETVLAYLDLCRKFWSSDGGKLDEWTKEINAGRIPEFGGNLLY